MLTATICALFLRDLTAIPRFISSSTVSVLLKEIKILSCSSSPSPIRSPLISEIAMFCAARWVANEAMVQVNKIIMMVPFNTSSFNKRIGSPVTSVPNTTLYPINTAASVAAAWALLNPNNKRPSSQVNLKFFSVTHAAINFEAVAIMVITKATNNAVQPFVKVRTSTNIPTPIKKKGIKIAFPTKSIRFIKAEVFGINRFNANPARKAPIIASKPAASAKKDAKNTKASTKIYWPTESS